MKLHPFQQRLRQFDPVVRTGRVRRIMPGFIEADGPDASLGTICEVEGRTAEGPSTFQAEVVRVDRDGVTLSPFEQGVPTRIGALVTASARTDTVPVGDAFLGRAIDALGRPIDQGGSIRAASAGPLHGITLSPLDRTSPAAPLHTGIRAIDGLLTLGRGQRIGLFAASGVGKTTLMSQIARQVEADAAVICLVGERGREVEAIWHGGLDAGARARTTLVAATSDQSAAMRVRAGEYALALAEHLRAEGKHVLLLLDSVTRLAMAMREIGLAAGEPPTVRAYTPGVFAAIPRLVERCGALKGGGAITAVMTVLSETDDLDDPVCEMMKSLLDGHILLSRSLAERGHYPAIDIGRSISRQAEKLVDPLQARQAQRVGAWLSLYEASRTLIDTGLYVKGTNPDTDQAIDRHGRITAFLRQPRDQNIPAATTAAAMAELVRGAP